MSKRYTDQERADLIEKIIESVATMSTNQACKLHSVPNSTFLDWIGNDPIIADNHARARLLFHDRLADEVMAISDEVIPLTPDGRSDNAAVQRNRLRVDSRKWLLSKLRPDKYGDRLQLAGDKDNPLNIVGKVERVVIIANGDKEIDYIKAPTPSIEVEENK